MSDADLWLHVLDEEEDGLKGADADDAAPWLDELQVLNNPTEKSPQNI